MINQLEKTAVLLALQSGEVDLQGQFLLGSNYTFLAGLVYEENTLPVVYKPTRGERPLWDFPLKSLSKREVAAFVVSEALGWDLVPPSVFRKKGPLGPGSLQLFVEHDPEYHYFRFSENERQRLRPAALFDLVINNADRKGGHVLMAPDGHLWLIDHGICFHVEDKLRTVIWDFSEEAIPETLLAEITRLMENLQNKTEPYEQLRRLLRVGEINAMIKRIQRILSVAVYPAPTSRFAFPYPPV
ncbi:MAG: SCO1664 family protein [Anaerolineae bacterium]|nr:SCO1664 family protein [Anaerolineae bacterium]